MGRISPAYYVQDGVIPRTRLAEVLRQIDGLAADYRLRVANVFHAGDGNLHPLVCYDDRVEGEAARAEELAGLIIKACVDAGGSITGEHGVGVDKKAYMPSMFAEDDLATFQRLRCAFDPDGLANPGKVMPTTASTAASAWMPARRTRSGAWRRLAARPDRADRRRARARRADVRSTGHALGPLPGLYGVRDGLPIRGQVRPSDRAGPGAGGTPSPASADRAGAAPTAVRDAPHPARLRALKPLIGLGRRPRIRALTPAPLRTLTDVQWATVAPSPNATKQPNFNASDPNAYPAKNWAIYDQAIKSAQQAGITVDLEVTGGSPRWASGKNYPKGATSCWQHDVAYCAWMPNAKMYGQFVHAVTERYDGHFKPTGASTTLPAVHFWSFWNEPNFGQDLGPQATNGSTVPYAPQAYRALLAAGWKALQQTQQGVRNTTLVGELAATGYPLHAAGHPGSLPGNGAIYLSLDFMRAVYCLSPNYQKLTGSTAKLYGCPTTGAAASKFRSQNPGLFNATGFAIHAYDSKQAPNQSPSSINPSYATFPVLKRVEAALDKATHAWGSGKHYPIYNDEYGYITSPPAPKSKGDPSEATAAAELNQAEYISYKDPRIAAYGQYLINDPVPAAQQIGGGFASGLYTSKGKPKADAGRLPAAGVAAEDDRQAPARASRSGAGPARRRCRSSRRADGLDPDAEGRQGQLDDDPDGQRSPSGPATSTSTRSCPTAATCGCPTPTRRPRRCCPPTWRARRSSVGPSRSPSAAEVGRVRARLDLARTGRRPCAGPFGRRVRTCRHS